MKLNMPVKDVSATDDFGGFYTTRERYTMRILDGNM